MIECNINSNFPFNLLVIIALLTIHTNNSLTTPSWLGGLGDSSTGPGSVGESKTGVDKV